MVLNFKINDSGKIIPFKYDENATVEAFIKDFLRQRNLVVTLDKKIYSFTYSGRILNSDANKGIKLKDIIETGATIHMVRKQNMNYSKIFAYHYIKLI